MTDHQNLHKELDLIQQVIERMARNSFMLKGWALSLVVIIPALMNDGFNGWMATCVYIALAVMVICFWYLDAWFLHKERCYRKLYNDVRKKRLKEGEEDMYSLDYTCSENIGEKEVGSVGSIMLSATLSVFYAIPGFITIFFIGLSLIK
jgi:hypothetical protein